MISLRPFYEMESKWQALWEKEGVYRAFNPSDRQAKFYGLIEFPYPSGDGLHVGHCRSHIAIDVVTRKRRMEGKNVLYPIGWDAFGLPTENFAIKNKLKPAEATEKNIANFKRQIKSCGVGFDWSREINTTDPTYYKWTQWQFLKFFNSWYDDASDRARPIEELPIPKEVMEQGELAVRIYRDDRRLAFKARSTINWCPTDKIGLANEEAQGGICERCGTPVEKREKEQWMLRITKYAERLLKDLDTVDYLQKIKIQQVNWIGKSKGINIEYPIDGTDKKVTVFTTRPDTNFGATFLALAPDGEFVVQHLEDFPEREAVRQYVEETKKKSDLERTTEGRKKTGCFTGWYALNQLTEKKMPVYVSDFVLGQFGTGAVVGVPGHDRRDFEFAEIMNLEVIRVVVGKDGDTSPIMHIEQVQEEDGTMMNSSFLDGMEIHAATKKIMDSIEEQGWGKKTTTYKLRDWVFSRQRYWGEPIPIVYCKKCGYVPVPEAQLPVILPDVEAYEPTDTGESPLAKVRSWVEVKCPSCGGAAERETDTMPNWAGSSWYFLRYGDPHNEKEFASTEALKYWMPVDLYNGGMEHTTLHLLYSRFWYKMLFDLSLVPSECGSEPYARRRSHAMILGEGGVKMSKSKGNVINPDEVVQEYGADVFRVYEMFMGPYDQDTPWDPRSIEGVRRFLDKVWGLFDDRVGVNQRVHPGQTHGFAPTSEIETLYHQTVKKITDGIEALQFNTCISQLMILTNAYQEAGGIPSSHGEGYLKVLAPFAPHMTEELWHACGHTDSIHRSAWPPYDASKLQFATFELVIQVNGKVRDRLMVEAGISEEETKQKALASEKIKEFLAGQEPKKVINVAGKLVNIVI